ncbi:hypothetical protein DLAC_03004 [Tieghemostelium lacteum]|uniref:Uncharacterized protein n=1 Tax=Tieghemostelium lacteum TaxID=361077 RepID=A0A152A3Z5_TIELA|nr:hypothetical protein DLAC_03004 [Tieghemostelium lacteum]|eukprot:KYR00940.1 hypothetical protein DLAC_03004 [Tieghemostelium lacteum]
MTPYLQIIHLAYNGSSSCLHFLVIFINHLAQLLQVLPLSHKIILTGLYLSIFLSVLYKFIYDKSPIKDLESFGSMPGDFEFFPITSISMSFLVSLVIFIVVAIMIG